MKKVSLILTLTLLISLVPQSFAFPAGEKTAKGRIELGGDLSFYHGSYENASKTDLEIFPRFGHFVADGLSLETRLIFIVRHEDKTGGNVRYSESESDFGGLFTLAYHFEGKNGSNSVPFLFGGLGLLSHDNDRKSGDGYTVILPQLGAGIKFFISKHAVLRGEIFYQHLSNADGVEDDDADEMGIRCGVSVFVK